MLKHGSLDAGMEVTFAEVFDVQSSDFSPLLTRLSDSGAQYLFVIFSHAASDVFVKHWYDAKLALPIGGLDVKSMDANFYERGRQGDQRADHQLCRSRAADREDDCVAYGRRCL